MKALAVGPWQASIITAGRNVTIVMPWRTRHRGPVILYIDRWPQQQPKKAIATASIQAIRQLTPLPGYSLRAFAWELTGIKRVRGFADIPDDQP